MLKGFKDFFYLHRGEQRAVLVLFASIILVYGILIFSAQKPAVVAVDSTGFNKEVKAFLREADSSRFSANRKNSSKDYYSGYNNANYSNGYSNSYKFKPLTPFPFDPNKLDEKDWMKLGLPDRLVKTILNYRSKGGHFYQKEDLQKIYGLSQQQYSILEPYIIIAPKLRPIYPLKTSVIKAPVHIVSLNSADSAELDGLKGIGPAYALRIIRYRDLLGGFARPEQLLEVYDLDSTMYEVLRPSIRVDPSQIKKMNINSCPFPALKRHPYIGYYLAKAIADYRVKFGKFRSIEELHLLKGVTPAQIEKLKPYVVVSE